MLKREREEEKRREKKDYFFFKFKAYGFWTRSFLLCWRRGKEVRWGCNKVQGLRLVGLRFTFCVELEEEKKKTKQKVIKCKLYGL